MTITPSVERLPKPLEYTFAGIFGISLVWDAASFITSQKKYEDLTTSIKLDPARLQKAKEAKKEYVTAGVTLLRTSAQTLTFSHSVKWLNLAKTAGPIGVVACLATLFLSGLKIQEGQKETKEPHKDNLHKIKPLLMVAEHVCYVAWAVLEIISLVMGAAFMPVLSGFLLVGCIAACTVSMIVEDQIKEKNKRKLALKPT